MQRFNAIVRLRIKQIALKPLLFASLICVLLLVGFVACKKPAKDTDCHFYSTVTIPSITGPDTVNVGAYVEYNLRYLMPTSCSKFLGIQRTTNGMNATLTIQLENTGCNCADVITSGETKYSFQPGVSGTYTIQLPQPSGIPPIIKKIIVP